MTIHKLNDSVELKLVSYDVLIQTKLRSHRPKDLEDISKLEQLRNNKK